MNSSVLLAIILQVLDEKLAELPIPERGPQGLRGLRGTDGEPGKDGKDFIWEENEEKLRALMSDLKVSFGELTHEQLESLRENAAHEEMTDDHLSSRRMNPIFVTSPAKSLLSLAIYSLMKSRPSVDLVVPMEKMVVTDQTSASMKAMRESVELSLREFIPLKMIFDSNSTTSHRSKFHK